MTVPHVCKWYDGEPADLLPGMAVKYESGATELIGSIARRRNEPIARWAQLVKDYELEWLGSLRK